jgi:hypothetical protein
MKTHLHPTTFLSGDSDISYHILFLSRVLSSSSVAAFLFGSSLVTCQHLDKVTKSNNIINIVCAGDMLEYEIN